MKTTMPYVNVWLTGSSLAAISVSANSAELKLSCVRSQVEYMVGEVLLCLYMARTHHDYTYLIASDL